MPVPQSPLRAALLAFIRRRSASLCNCTKAFGVIVLDNSHAGEIGPVDPGHAEIGADHRHAHASASSSFDFNAGALGAGVREHGCELVGTGELANRAGDDEFECRLRRRHAP